VAGPAVHFEDGAGGFFACDTAPPRSGHGLDGISAGDADGDGGADVAFANASGGLEVWVWNDAARRWQLFSGSLPATGDYYATQLCDMDLDVACDLVALHTDRIEVWTGNGLGSWTLATQMHTRRQYVRGAACGSRLRPQREAGPGRSRARAGLVGRHQSAACVA
jgi:hypothetical protein